MAVAPVEPVQPTGPQGQSIRAAAVVEAARPEVTVALAAPASSSFVTHLLKLKRVHMQKYLLILQLLLLIQVMEQMGYSVLFMMYIHLHQVGV
jgi:hypothetical protein